jgi:hypothetical protein
MTISFFTFFQKRYPGILLCFAVHSVSIGFASVGGLGQRLSTLSWNEKRPGEMTWHLT